MTRSVPSTKPHGICALLFLCGGVLGMPTAVAAGEMEPTLARLTLGAPDCGEGFAGTLCPNNTLYRQLVSQFGTALAPPVTSPARTTGYGGFFVGLHTTITGIDAEREYWQRGTVGGPDAAQEGANRDVTPALVWTRFELRKGLPLGFELAGTVGHGSGTGLWSVGGSMKFAFLEGFREGTLGYVPDLSVRFAMETLVGSPQLNLTVPSLDWTLSKPFTLGGVATITPMFGIQTLWLIASSDVVDLTPSDDAFQRCEPVPGHALPAMGQSPVRCGQGGDAVGYRDNAVFDAFTATRWRGFLGAQLQYAQLAFTMVVHLDLLEPQAADREVPERLPRQVTFLLGGGVGF